MIKKWNQFINESRHDAPGPGTNGSVSISIDDDEAEYFSSEPALQRLISEEKVALFDNELWYMSDDMNTINVLKEYFPDMEDSQIEESKSWRKEYDSKDKQWIVTYAGETKSKEFDEEKDADKFITGLKNEMSGKPESYRDKMKRLVANSKERAKKRK